MPGAGTGEHQRERREMLGGELSHVDRVRGGPTRRFAPYAATAGSDTPITLRRRDSAVNANSFICWLE
jgi:hypothetical protein